MVVARHWLISRNFMYQQERPASIAEPDFEGLRSGVRSLLLHDGTLTNALEAQRFSPTIVEVRDQHETRIGHKESRWLAAAHGTLALRRQVAIRDAHTRELLVDADSVILMDRLPPTFAQVLAGSTNGLGAALLRMNLEYRREMLWCGVRTSTDRRESGSQGRPGLVRCSRIIHAELPVVCIQEVFPIDGD